MTGGPSLTAEQREAVALPDGPHLLTAPPGSGKTEVLIRRTIHLLESSPSEVFRLLALTYTYKAAEELRTRVRQAVPGDDQWRVTAVTFHAFGHDMLENYGGPVGIGADAAVFDDNEDKQRLLAALLQEEGWDLDDVTAQDWRALFASIGALKSGLCPPISAPDEPCLGSLLTLQEAYESYEAALASVGGLDFEGMLSQAYRLLLVDPWVGEHYRRMYRHILVDEGQEMNLAQYELLRTLCADQLRAVFVVADRDQSINAYAGGGPQHLDRFETEFGAEVHHLTKNFRSARSIVAAASRLAEHITTRSIAAPAMVAQTLAEGWIGAWEFDDGRAEAAGIADWVGELIKDGLPAAWTHEGEDGSVRAEDICILGRTRYAFDAVVVALHERGIETLVRTEEGGLFESALGRAVYYALRLVANPRDLPSRQRLVAELGDAIDDLPSDPSPPDVARWLGALGLPAAISEPLVDAARDAQVRDAVVPRLVSASVDPSDQDLAWLGDQAELDRRWTDYQMATRPQERTLRGYLKLLAQLQRTVRDDPGVRILTPHRARGLGFRAVVIVGMSERGFPSYHARTDAEIDEERRTVYVAATRAARALLLTRPAVRYDRYDREWRDPESRFVAEMGLRMEAR